MTSAKIQSDGPWFEHLFTDALYLVSPMVFYIGLIQMKSSF